MKRQLLVRRLELAGCILIRYGARQDGWRNPTTGVLQPVPRHAEINENLAKHILKLLTH